VRLADDSRGRVPFAFVGVVLLVSSASFAAAVGTQTTPETNDPTRAAEEATAVARTALERAVSRASRRAARNPVIEPANTTVGRVIDNRTAFDDYLRIRVYLAARDVLGRATTTVGDTRAAVTLPAVTDAESLRRAKRSVRIEALPGERPRIAVTFRNASVVVRQDGRVLERRQYAPTVAVETPVMALHRRTEVFERRLTNSPDKGGLAARVTGRLAALAWTRGLAQYGGAPISNVVATRHLEVVTNGALLDVQRAVFGRSDPAGERAHTFAGERVAGTDMTAGITNAEWTEEVLGQAGGRPVDATVSLAGHRAIQEHRPPLTVGINRTADTAFVKVASGEPSGLDRVVDDIYTAEAGLRARSQVVAHNRTGAIRPGSGNWTLLGVTNTTNTTVTPADASPLQSADGRHRLASFARTVTVTRRTVRTWLRGGRVRQTVSVKRTRHLVRAGVFGRHATSTDAPRRGIRTPHRPGGPLDGRNFAGVRERAIERLLDDRGLSETVRQAVRGPIDRGPVSINVPPPEGIETWLYRDLAVLRERVRDVSVAVDRRSALTGNPTDRLLERFRTRRDSLLRIPESYPGAAAKARVAARVRYLDTIEAVLERRASRTESFRSRLWTELDGHGVSASTLLDRLDTPGSRSNVSVETAATGVRGTPPYLTTSAVTPDHTDAVDGRYYPLVARNRNLFAAPGGDVATEVAKVIVRREPRTVRLLTAGRALRAANHTLSATHRTVRRIDGRSLRERRNRLVDATSDTLDTVRERLRGVAVPNSNGATTVGDRSAVDAGLGEWGSLHERALAAANGSLADAVARRALPDSAGGVRHDRMRLRLRVALVAAVRDTGVEAATVGPVDNATTEIARAAVAGGVEAAADSWTGRAARPSLSGLPLAPLPGWWYATLNVWTATIRGRYARFAVSAPAGSPVPSRNLTYVRRSATVTVDVDDDGTAEKLGRNRPVSFDIDGDGR